MAEIGLKQIKKETYLDLSKQDLAEDGFIDGFVKFTDETSSFLSGTAVSLIMPEGFNTDDEKLSQVLNQLKSELNKRNISLRSSSQTGTLEEFQSKVEEFNNQDTQKQKSDKDENQQLPDTLYVKANLRSGQLIQYPGNVVVMGDVNPSAEIIAMGDIVVWGTLRGVVHAGAGGENTAIISALKINSGQLRISDRFIALPNKSSKLSKVFKKGSNDFAPETAKIVGNEIKIIKGVKE